MTEVIYYIFNTQALSTFGHDSVYLEDECCIVICNFVKDFISSDWCYTQLYGMNVSM